MNIHGIGLGLTISKKIVEQFNGEVSFESTENEGSTFRFVLKLFDDNNPACEEQGKVVQDQQGFFALKTEDMQEDDAQNNNFAINVDSLVFTWQPEEVVRPVEFVKDLDQKPLVEDVDGGIVNQDHEIREESENQTPVRQIDFNNFFRPKRSDRMKRSVTPVEKQRHRKHDSSTKKLTDQEVDEEGSFSTVNVSVDERLEILDTHQRSKKILIVDDEQYNRMAVGVILDVLGHPNSEDKSSYAING